MLTPEQERAYQGVYLEEYPALEHLNFLRDEIERLNYKCEELNFWKDVLVVNGEIDVDAVKKELHDFYFLMEQVPKVYNHITNGELSKPNYYADAIIAQYDDAVTKQVDEAVKEETDELRHELEKHERAVEKTLERLECSAGCPTRNNKRCTNDCKECWREWAFEEEK